MASLAGERLLQQFPTGRNFPIGRKELYLPAFRIALCRTDNLPATYAKFHVPLWFSKIDLRDYLFHAYNVRIFSARSYVKQQRVIQGKPNAVRPMPRRWYRPRAKKFMTVELEQPFRWPEEPEDYSPWNKDQTEAAEKEQAEFQKTMAPDADTLVNEERIKSMREQAKALLEGKAKWQPGNAQNPRIMIGRGKAI